MTTIALHLGHMMVATDSRLCQGDTIASDNHVKRFIEGHLVFFVAGQEAARNNLIKDFKANALGQTRHFVGAAFVWDRKAKIAYQCSYDLEDGFWALPIVGPHEAIGSGSPYALAAMDLGFNARTAVRSAMKRDIRTGGRVRTYRLT